jgi:hypothetical protein
MGLREERRSKRFAKQNDLELRVALFLAGVFLAGPCFLIAVSGEESTAFALSIFVLLGSFSLVCLYVSLFGTSESLHKVGNASGTHEVLVVIVILAIPIAWIIRQMQRK